MARRRTPEEHPNHERWLVSYADFITLMFAFFVVLYAASNADRQKAMQVSESVARALQDSRVAATVMQMLGAGPAVGRGPAKTAAKAGAETNPVQFAELTPELKTLTAELKEEIASGKIQISLEARGLVISLKEAAFFPSGDDTVASDGYPVIERVVTTIQKVPNPVRLEGHTDSQPIRTTRFRDNWDLSAARSIAMLQLLASRFGVPVSRMAAVAYAETLPIDTNETVAGRARNRRVDIAILNDKAALKEAQPATAKKL
jgi:chemotaxis protein MotB